MWSVVPHALGPCDRPAWCGAGRVDALPGRPPAARPVRCRAWHPSCQGSHAAVFTVGQLVVHPHHGPSRVRAHVARTVRGSAVDHLDLEVLGSRLTVLVPAATTAADRGVREPYPAESAEELFDLLREPTVHEEQSWSRRFNDNQARISEGGSRAVACVVRDLLRRRHAHGLSPAEKEQLAEASRPIVQELALILGISVEEAERRMTGAVVQDGPTAAAG